MQPGEIFLAQFPFGDIPGMKLRPVLLLTGLIGPVPEVLVAYISSVTPPQLLFRSLHVPQLRVEKSAVKLVERNHFPAVTGDQGVGFCKKDFKDRPIVPIIAPFIRGGQNCRRIDDCATGLSLRHSSFARRSHSRASTAWPKRW